MKIETFDLVQYQKRKEEVLHLMQKSIMMLLSCLGTAIRISHK
jgi:hypothetical protein